MIRNYRYKPMRRRRWWAIVFDASRKSLFVSHLLFFGFCSHARLFARAYKQCFMAPWLDANGKPKKAFCKSIILSWRGLKIWPICHMVTSDLFFMIYIDIFWSDSTAGSVRKLMPAIDRGRLIFHFGVMAMIKKGIVFQNLTVLYFIFKKLRFF